ncbi:MAG: hypothetical protein EOM44_14445 [Bacteroidia bacterium]|nr:hypothetical protein [Bacteroidia bacterium]
MKLLLSPQRRDDTLTLSKSGDALTVNGTVYDFSPLPDGATLPRDAIDCEWICGDVSRINGELEIPILFPHGPDASEAARFPEPLTVTSDGQVVLPE